MSQQNTNSTNWYSAVDKTSDTDDQRIDKIAVLPPPEHLIRFFPISGTPTETLISKTRKKIRDIIHGKDDRLLVIIGPCSIHDPRAALEYCQRLLAERERFSGELEIVMRVYFEKPRTTVGWKGLINDPYLDESYRIEEGLRLARQVLMEINRLGMPAGSEFLDVISPQYIADLISWGAIGARTTESQVMAISKLLQMRSRRLVVHTTSYLFTRTVKYQLWKLRAIKTVTSFCVAAKSPITRLSTYKLLALS